jgi:hypothetical protein
MHVDALRSLIDVVDVHIAYGRCLELFVDDASLSIVTVSYHSHNQAWSACYVHRLENMQTHHAFLSIFSHGER